MEVEEVGGGGCGYWVRGGSRGSRGKRGCGDVAHCDDGERTRFPHRMPPQPGEAEIDLPPVYLRITNSNSPITNLTEPNIIIQISLIFCDCDFVSGS